MLDAQSQRYVVDWDQPILAPKERDLMFVTVGSFVADQRHEELFFQCPIAMGKCLHKANPPG